MTSTRVPIPHGRTARRIEWSFLPPSVRAAVGARLGSPVVDAESQGGGFTPGFASVLTCADGSRHFVKAAALKAQRQIAESYREEARKLAELPPEAPAPRLLWTDEVDEWLLLGIEYAEAELPPRPWTQEHLQAASDMLVTASELLTPAPGVRITRATDECSEYPDYWQSVTAGYSGIDQADEAAALAARFAEVVDGDTLVHYDVRSDNLLFCADGRVLLCDWNWPVVGAAWLDSLILLIGPRGDGLDVEAHIASHSLLSEVPAEHVDVLLALLTGFFLRHALEPVPPSSPHLRDVQLWQGEVCWEWLAERRGWTV